ncbi:MAG: T9SS type A sorting domain-containing protein [Chitinophagaceae bacterium]
MKIILLATTWILFILTNIQAQVNIYNPFTQNIHFQPEPSTNGFACGQHTTLQFTAGLTTASDANLWITQPLKIIIKKTGFILANSNINACISGSYAANFDWAISSSDTNKIIGTQNQLLYGIGNMPLFPNTNASGIISLSLITPSSQTFLNIEVSIDVPLYMQTFNSINDDMESSSTQSYCSPAIYCQEAPILHLEPSAHFCVGDKVVLVANSQIGSNFTWHIPSTCTNAQIIDTIDGKSQLIINQYTADCNGLFRVSALKPGCSIQSSEDSIVLNSSKAALIQSVTTQCVNNNGVVSVQASHPDSLALVYAINNSNFQSSPNLNTYTGSSFFVAVKPIASQCVSYYQGQCVYCPNQAINCALPPKDSIDAPSLVCANSPIFLSGFFQNASEVFWTSSGNGFFTKTSSTISGENIAYHPSSDDIKNGFVSIFLTSNDPDGNGPCMAAHCAKHIQLIQNLVVSDIQIADSICMYAPLHISVPSIPKGATVSWDTPWGPVTDKDIDIDSVLTLHQGVYTAHISAFACTSISVSDTINIHNPPIFNFAITSQDEYCYQAGNGKINLNFWGDYSTLKICIQGPISMCKNASSSTAFNYLCAGIYYVSILDTVCNTLLAYDTLTIHSPQAVPKPSISTTTNHCVGETIILSGSTPLSSQTIEWTKYQSNFYALGNQISIPNIQLLQSGTYIAKTIDSLGCASAAETFNLSIYHQPELLNLDLTCENNVAHIYVSASGVGNLYAIDGLAFQDSSHFSHVSAGNHIIYVKNPSLCIDSQTIYVPPCGCNINQEMILSMPTLACGYVAIPIQVNTAQILSIQATSTGSGTFSPIGTQSPYQFSYTPSPSDIQNGSVEISLISNDPDGNGPCLPLIKKQRIQLRDSLSALQIFSNQNSFCEGDTLLLQSIENIPTLTWELPNTNFVQASSLFLDEINSLQSGMYTAIHSGFGCTTKKDSILISIQPKPILNVTYDAMPEGCRGHGNGSIDVYVTGGSGNYFARLLPHPTLYSIDSSKHFAWLAPDNYTLSVSDRVCKNGNYTILVPIDSGLWVSPPLSISANTPVCEGETLVLKAQGENSGSYAWYAQNHGFIGQGQELTLENVDLSYSDTYRVFHLIDGCASEALSIPLHIFETPQNAFVHTECNEMNGFSSLEVYAEMMSTDTLLYALNDGVFQASPFFNNLSNGLYTIRIKNKSGACEQSIQQEIACACQCSKSSASIFPNPSSGQFKLMLSLMDGVDFLQYAIYDIQGKIIMKKVIEVNQLAFIENISMPSFSKGYYLLQVETNQEKLKFPLRIN